MRHSFEKILFLGVMLAVTISGNGATRGDSGETTNVPFVARNTLSSGLTQSYLGSSAPLAEAQSSPERTEGARAGSEAKSGALRAEDSYLPPAFYQAEQTSIPEFHGEAGLVADITNGEVYFSVRPLRRWPLASLTKLITAVTAARGMADDRILELTKEDFPPGDDSVSQKPEAGKYSVADLISAALIPSSNAAAEALARNYGRDEFLLEMNAITKDWGMEATNFADPTGLSVANQSTVSDIHKMVKRIYEEYPELFKISRKPRANITEVGGGKRVTLESSNLFAGRADFLGGKTGYTDDARGNLVSLFTHERRPILVVVLGTDDRFGETEKLINWFRATFRLSR